MPCVFSIKKQLKNGFSITELIVVIVVIGILASISVVGYTGWRKSTTENQLKSELIMAAAAMENYRNFNGEYPQDINEVFTSKSGAALSGGSQDGENYSIDIASSDGQSRRSTNNNGDILIGPAPVIYLDAADKRSYSGAGSTVWNDLSGNGHNVTGLSSIGFDPDAGGALVFDGNDEGIITNSSASPIDFGSAQTLIIALKQPLLPITDPTRIRRNPWNQSYGGYGTINQDTYDDCKNKMRYYFGTTGTNAAPYKGICGPAVVDNTWVIYSTTRDFASMKWYANGSLVSTYSNTYATPLENVDTHNISIGKGYAGYWQGSMSLIIAYTKALTADEIKDVFNKYKDRYGL